MNLTVLASLCAGIAVTCTALVFVELFSALSARYRERFIQETSVEMDDVLLNMPPSKILDVSLALAAACAAAAVFAVGFLVENMTVMKGVVGALLAAGLAFPAPRLLLRHLRKQRLAKFNEQLEDALLSISGSLKAGFSINQALEVIANENRKPLSSEFSLLMHEIHLGVSLDEALDKMVARLNCPDFELVAISIITARQTGGELTSILERLASVIRERVRITGRIKALTAQGRMQAVIIGLMPWALFIAMMYIATDMMTNFFSSLPGILCIIVVIVLDVSGFLLIRKITSIDI